MKSPKLQTKLPSLQTLSKVSAHVRNPTLEKQLKRNQRTAVTIKENRDREEKIHRPPIDEKEHDERGPPSKEDLN